MDVRIILKRVLRKYFVNMWFGLKRVRMEFTQQNQS
jgi:hypothetical protein